jgi:hypothetical protein
MLVRLNGAVRLALGLAIIAAPRLSTRLFALPEAGTTRDGRFVARLAGNRDAMLGAALLLAPAEQQTALLRTCLAVDAGDLLLALGSSGDGLGGRALFANMLAAGSAVVGELWTLRLARKAPRG